MDIYLNFMGYVGIYGSDVNVIIFKQQRIFLASINFKMEEAYIYEIAERNKLSNLGRTQRKRYFEKSTTGNLGPAFRCVSVGIHPCLLPRLGWSLEVPGETVQLDQVILRAKVCDTVWRPGWNHARVAAFCYQKKRMGRGWSCGRITGR